MQDDLRRLMVTYKILNEGELYCTNLNFNLDDERHEKLIGDPGAKDEDAVKQLNSKLRVLIEEYRMRFVQICEDRKYNRVQFARAIYFTTYFNIRNDDYMSYVSKFFLRDARRDIDKFTDLWRQTQIDSGFELGFWERMQELHYYKKTLKKGKLGSDDKILSILAHK
jgi:hypothetical protein